MYLIITRNFPPELGGMQILMWGLSNSLAKHGIVKVFAEDHKDAVSHDKNVKYQIERIGGFKFFRKFRKANLINEYLKENTSITTVIADHWKSLEKINSDLLKNKKTICLIHSKEINHPVNSSINKRVLKTLSKTNYIVSNSNFTKKLAIIGGTRYGGENKKTIFGVLNFILPGKDIMPMHCSANLGLNGDTALFFGLSGTGKTTLSADPKRMLIGDDEHGWSDDGIFNFEGGCYAKTINLSKKAEPQIWNAIRDGAVLENVVLNPKTMNPDYDDDSLTENTRVVYPLDYIPGAVIPSVAGHPKSIIFLTADAFGVLPPISKLTTDGAMYHFMSGYTSKLAGTERGIIEPQPTFSHCFGSVFMPRPAEVYAKMLGERIVKHNTNVYLVNTGWSGGPYGVGKRFKIDYTRKMVTRILFAIKICLFR